MAALPIAAVAASTSAANLRCIRSPSVCPSHTANEPAGTTSRTEAQPDRCETLGRATGDDVSAAGGVVCRARVTAVRRAARPARGRHRGRRAHGGDPARDTRTTPAGRPCHCACSAACTGLVLERRAGALGAYYPSVGGTWEPDGGTAAFLALLEKEPDAVREWLDQPPQTNEVGRASALIGGLLHLPVEHRAPVRLFEIGSSGGLNLLADRFEYVDDSGQRFGQNGSPVRLEPAWSAEPTLSPWPGAPVRGERRLRHQSHRRHHHGRQARPHRLCLARPGTPARTPPRRAGPGPGPPTRRTTARGRGLRRPDHPRRTAPPPCSGTA